MSAKADAADDCSLKRMGDSCSGRSSLNYLAITLRARLTLILGFFSELDETPRSDFPLAFFPEEAGVD